MRKRKFLVYFKDGNKEKKVNISANCMEDAILLGRVECGFPVTHVKKVGTKTKIQIDKNIIVNYITNNNGKSLVEKHADDVKTMSENTKKLREEFKWFKKESKLFGLF